MHGRSCTVLRPPAPARPLLSLAMAATLLAGCGGGSDEASSDETTTAVHRTTTTVRRTTTTTRPTTTTVDILDQGLTHEWTTDEGWKYRLRVVFGEPRTMASPGGCIDTPPPGKTHITFLVVLENLITDRSAPTPQVTFGTNLTEDGSAVNPAITTLEGSNESIEISPGSGGPCFLAFSTSESDGEFGDLSSYWGVVGNVADPIPAGLQLIVRTFEPAGIKDQLLPYEEVELPLTRP